MRVNRTFLYAGIFLVAIGGVLVAADLGVVDDSILADALRLWPLAVIAIGLGLVLRRTRVSLPGGMLAAAVPGLLLGSALAAGAAVQRLLRRARRVDPRRHQAGHLRRAGRVSVTTDCGSLVVTTGAGSGWRLDARDDRGSRSPSSTQSARSLSIASTGDDGWLGTGPDALGADPADERASRTSPWPSTPAGATSTWPRRRSTGCPSRPTPPRSSSTRRRPP